MPNLRAIVAHRADWPPGAGEAGPAHRGRTREYL